MMNCFGTDNCYLYLLIILLIVCCCGGSVCGILDKLSDCSCLIPLALVFMCCCNGKGGFKAPGFGCGCK